MKNFNRTHTGFLILIFLTFIGCSEDVLVEKPPHIISPDNLFVNAEGFEAGLYGLYDEVRRERAGRTLNNTSNDLMNSGIMIGTDNAYGNHDAAIEQTFNQWKDRVVPSQDYFNNVWEWLYETINAANTIIGRAEVADIAWTEEEKNQVIGEARLIRAWAYRHLTFLWGDVPLNLTESTGTTIKTDWQRTPVAEVRQAMEEDLRFAEAHLAEAPVTPGRAAKGVATHYLAELYLTIGDNEQARSKAQELIQQGPYRLVTQRYGVEADQPGTPFTDMFIDGNSNREEGNTEVLWTIQNEYLVNGGEGNNIMRRWWVNRYYNIKVEDKTPIAITVENGGRGLGRFGPTKFALSLYEPGDDRYSEFAWRKFWTMNDPKNLPAGFNIGDTVFLDTSGPEKLDNPNWPNPRKWDWATPLDPTDSKGYNDQMYLRLAETYLLLAEAQMKLGDNAAAAETINILRRRANAAEITTGEVTMDFILDERSRELFSEEHRRYALLRTGKWLERTRAYNTIAGTEIADFNQLFPIPQAVIDANIDTPMEQNPGYN